MTLTGMTLRRAAPWPHPFPSGPLDRQAGRREVLVTVLFLASRMTDGGHDIGGHLHDPATLAASLTAQTLKRLPLAQALPGHQDPLGLLDHHPGIQGPLQLGGQLPRSSLCRVLAMVRAARSVKATRASSPSGDQGWTLAENTTTTTTTPIACWL